MIRTRLKMPFLSTCMRVIFCFSVCSLFFSSAICFGSHNRAFQRTYLTAIQNQNKKRAQKTRIFVNTIPEGATVRILNIVPKFHQGMILQPGEYNIQVSAKNYETVRQWVALEAGEKKVLDITLQKSAPSQPSPIKTSPIKTSPIKELFRFHTVKSGETLYSITTRYSVSLSAIMQANNLSSPDIYIGQKLKIPLKPIIREAVDEQRQAESRKNMELGHQYRNQQDYKKAVEYYKRALRMNPYNIDVYYSLGFAYLKLKEQNKAIESFKQAIEINPYNAEAYYNMGLVYFVVGDKGAAFHNFEILKTLDSHLAERLLSYIRTM